MFHLRGRRLKVGSRNQPMQKSLMGFVLQRGQCMDIPIGLVHQVEAIDDSDGSSSQRITSTATRTGSFRAD